MSSLQPQRAFAAFVVVAAAAAVDCVWEMCAYVNKKAAMGKR